jgi:ABC-type phosphate transport system substrate-binding protein
VDGQRSYALEIKTPEGKNIAPTPENVAAKSYPMTRPLLLIVNDKPTQSVRVFSDFMLGARGQGLLKKHGFYGVDVLNKTKETK